MLSYNPLWKLLIDKNLTKTEFRKQLKISSATLAKMSKEQHVSLEVIDRICQHFKVQPEEIIEWKDDEKDANLSIY